MKNTLKIDFVKKQIVMDRTFAKKCVDTRSEEYAELQRVRIDYPRFKVITRKIKRNKHKMTYKGLTYAYMEDYISKHGSKEDIQKNFSNYLHLREIAKGNKRKGYPVIKKWFLECYPENAQFKVAA